MSAQRLAQSFHSIREQLAETYFVHGHAAAYLKRHTAAVDRFVCQLARLAQLPEQTALVAVGGYGRGEMFPYSDIDILILLAEGHDERTDQAVSTFVTSLWTLGLNVGSVVRTPSEMLTAAKADITVATAFLEARFLDGDSELFESTYRAFAKTMDARTFFRSKMLEMHQRHQRHAETPYALEPNIKESPGGLRDLQVFLWCAHCAGFGRTWRELAQSGLITDTEAYHLNRCQQFLRDLRVRLHLVVGRHEDRLIFDIQAALAKSAGLKSVGALLPSEALMRRYYLNAKNISQLQAILLAAMSDKLFGEQLSGKVVAIDEVFQASGDALDIVSQEAFAASHRNMIRAFYLYATHRELKRCSTRLLRALWHQRERIGSAFRNDRGNKELFLHTLQLRYGPYHFLKNLNLWGILGRFLPVWRRIVGQMQHDLFHAYTVDQHSLRVVKFLRRFSHSSYAHEYPLCSQLMNEIDKSWRVTLAGLFHDIAKGRGGNHSELGAKEVRAFGKSFRMDAQDIDYVEFLVREHLLMSQVAQKEDISDPEVIKRFVRTVGTKERLDGLFLLTVADIRGTSPKVWNAWKQHLLTQLYMASRDALEGSHTTKTRATVLAEHRRQACTLIERAGISHEAREAFWKELNLVYFLRHSAQDIAWHTIELAANPTPIAPVVRTRAICPVLEEGHPTDASVDAANVNHTAALEVLLYSPDQKDLFARVVSFFERMGLSVLDARIHTTAHGWALDTFLVQSKREQAPDDAWIARFNASLARVIEEAKPLPEPKPGKLSRRSRSFPTPPFVLIERAEGQKSWVLQITCTDRLGLLFAIAVILARHNINLATAKISTLDERVEDVFLIEGAILEDPDAIVRIESELIDAVANVH